MEKTGKKVMEEFEAELMDVGDMLDTSLPDPNVLEFYRRIRKREIVWNMDIDDTTVDVALYIKKWNEEDRGVPPESRMPIRIFINSDGGDVTAVMHVIDMITLSKTPVITIGMGKVYSAGGLLLMAGHKRYVFEHTSCLIHDGSSGAVGSVGKLLDGLRFTEASEKQIRRYILDRTKITEETFDKNYRRDWFLFADEMIQLGIADEIVRDIDQII